MNVRDGLDRRLPRLWRFCLVLSGNRSVADDLVQATCLRALEREDQFQPGTRLDRWLFRVAQTVWLNQLRAEKVRRGGGLVPVEQAGLIDAASDAEASLFANEVFSEVMALPEAQRAAVLLVYVEGYLYKEAAEHLDVPVGTVMSRLRRVACAVLEQERLWFYRHRRDRGGGAERRGRASRKADLREPQTSP
jgi:RNA polymerase sigma-70 factor, ECF subfamily